MQVTDILAIEYFIVHTQMFGYSLYLYLLYNTLQISLRAVPFYDLQPSQESTRGICP